MNNTKTKQIIAGLPEGEAMAWRDSGCNEYPEIDCGHRTAGFDTDDLKALAAAVPEWVPIRSEADLPDVNNGGKKWITCVGDGFGPTVAEGCYRFYEKRWEWTYISGTWQPIPEGIKVTAWSEIPPTPQPYQEDKDDIEEKIRKVTERGDAITGDEFERERR